jgi:membrane-bound lytic murein transglycosylase D
MLRIKICIVLFVLLIGCSARMSPQVSEMPRGEPAADRAPAATVKANDLPPSEKPPLPVPTTEFAPKAAPDSPDKKVASIREESLTPVKEMSPKAASVSPERVETVKPVQTVPAPAVSSPKKTATPPGKKNTASKIPPTTKPSKPQVHESGKEPSEEAERDIMEEALILLNESHSYWVNGDLESALEMLDQAYAILLDTNGNPDIARQKDDLRLMISKRILTLYNSIQTTAKGIRSEIPVITNADVEKEIRQFQTVERDFFISSYHRSAMYRPIILRELKKAGLPEELAWLPLVESGFKINALSTARALGLWQFIPSTGYKYGLNRDDWVDERMDIEKSTRAAIDYLKELHNMFGDWLTVLAAYNCGEGRIMRNIASQHINYLDRFWDLYHKLPYETARYVPRFIATVLVIRDPQKYGIDLSAGKMSALTYEAVEINKSMRLQDIARKLDVPEEMMNILNAELRHRITPNKPYKLRVPTDMTGQLLKVVDDISLAETPRDAFRRGVVIKHRVRQGETLASIAGKYKTSEGDIRNANQLLRKKPLAAGQRLNIPIQASRAASTKVQKQDTVIAHKVQKGDTLASLARKYDIGIAEIKKANHFTDDKLKLGQMLRIEKVKSDPPRDPKKEGRKAVRAEDKGKAKPEKEPAQVEAAKAAETSAVKKYTVKKGDTLNKIARENHTTLDKLRKLNNIKKKDNIRSGQVILVK